MWWKIFLFVILGLTIIIAAALVYGSNRWQYATKEMHAKLEASHLPIGAKKYNVKDLIGLPAPVQRYFRLALKDGQSMVSAVRMEHTGNFNMSMTAEQWRPFTSTQRVVIHRPGFGWDARISMMPGIIVRVHDAYVAGGGILHAALFGLVTLADMRGTPEAAEGQLMRFFAEAAWYPTALLPNQGVQWEAVDDTSAKATMNDGKVTLTLLFRFNDAGLIGSVCSEARGRVVNGSLVLTPWEGRLWGYENRNGMQVPMEGEVAWLLPEGLKPYWRGRITKLSYEFAQ